MASRSDGSKPGGLESFATFFFQRMSELHQEGVLCDITVIVEGEEFKTHRLVLAGVSDYFRAMFMHNMIEKNKDSIELQGLKLSGFKPLLEYSYSGRLLLTMDNISAILETASFLQISDALEKCKKFLISSMDFTNSLDIIALGETFGVSDLPETRRKLILDNFMDFSQTKAFLELDHKEIASYLESDSLRASSEFAILKAALRWYQHDKTNRQKHAYDVLEKVRYTQDGWSTIEYASTEEPFNTCSKCKRLMEECVQFMQLPERKHLYYDHRTRVRYDKKTLIQLSGAIEDDDYGPSGHGDNNYFHRDFKIWLPLGAAAMSDPRSNFATVEINGFAVICGGYLYDDDIGTFMHVTNEVKTLHCSSGFALWDIPYMIEPRAHHVLVHCRDYLYAIGGKSDGQIWASVEGFELNKDEWSFKASLKTPLYDHAGCEYGNKVYISGGVEGDTVVNTMRCYDPETNTWETKAPMQSVRAGHTMNRLGDKLIACGGWLCYNQGGGHLNSVEAYDPIQDKWTYQSTMRSDVASHAATVMEDKLYVAGGQNSLGEVQSIILEYDPKKDEWINYGHLPRQLKSLGLCCLTVNLNKPVMDDEDWLVRNFEAVMLDDEEDNYGPHAVWAYGHDDLNVDWGHDDQEGPQHEWGLELI
ncbi:kelch-like protein 9 isoform X2 [Lineus longissimus]|uniref:kelch-like protein 9 isoform X2 n=1 Tax=Lineus longissimus TaxID=88925 RepID=UPI00315D28C1